MSRAFVKEDAGDDDLPERPQSSSANYVTPRGLELLRAKVAGLKSRLAGLEKDGREARELARDLRYYEGRLGGAILVDAAGRRGDEARFGATVTARDDAGVERVFSIVGQDEAEEGGGRISWDSSLGLALIGAKAGARVECVIEDRPRVLEVLSVEYPAR